MRGLHVGLAGLLLCSCGDDGAKTADAGIDAPADAVPDAPVETLGPPPALAMTCTDTMSDVYVLPPSLPAMDDSHRGDVFHCAPGESLSAYKVNAQIDAYNAGYTGAVAGHATSGFWTFRVAFRSTRNTVSAVRAEGDSTAVLLVPEKPLAGAPLVVFNHGSTGVAEMCAPSRLDLSGAVRDEDYPPLLLRLAGAGYTVISPDDTGFSFGQAPGYFIAEDEAHAVLDASRAAAKLLTAPPAKVVFVGHSQGGHAVIAAQSYAAAYGHHGDLVGVATLAPFWTSLDLFAAATTATGNLSTATDINSIYYAMEYAYAEGELREGAGHGVDVFATAKQAAARDAMLGGTCYDSAKLQALGAKPADFFDTPYVNTVGGDCAIGGTCTDPLPAKWKTYWQDERPPLDPNGAPVLAVFGGADTFITAGRRQCAVNRFDADVAATGSTTALTYCFDATAAHRDLPRTADADYMISWIAAKAGIGAAPAACTAPPTSTCPMFPKDY